MILVLFPVDNHDIISLKLFELTVDRTPEEEKLHRDVFLPSVDNMKLPESEHGDPGDQLMVGEGPQCWVRSEVTCAHSLQARLLLVIPPEYGALPPACHLSPKYR